MIGCPIVQLSDTALAIPEPLDPTIKPDLTSWPNTEYAVAYKMSKLIIFT
jgi:hypothetical protein